MIFLLPRWDMLIPWRVIIVVAFFPQAPPPNKTYIYIYTVLQSKGKRGKRFQARKKNDDQKSLNIEPPVSSNVETMSMVAKEHLLDIGTSFNPSCCPDSKKNQWRFQAVFFLRDFEQDQYTWGAVPTTTFPLCLFHFLGGNISERRRPLPKRSRLVGTNCHHIGFFVGILNMPSWWCVTFSVCGHTIKIPNQLSQ